SICISRVFLSWIYAPGFASRPGCQRYLGDVRALLDDSLPQTLAGSHGRHFVRIIFRYTRVALALDMGWCPGARRGGIKYGSHRAHTTSRTTHSLVAVT